MKPYEKCALFITGVLVAGLVTVSIARPPVAVTKSPRSLMHLASSETTRMHLASSETTRAKIPSLKENLALPSIVIYKSAKRLSRALNRLGYDLDAVTSGNYAVPRLFLASLPIDMAAIPESKNRKSLFFKTVLPLILQANEEILVERQRLWRLRHDMVLGIRLDAVDRLWLRMMEERYGVAENNIDGLLRLVDIIPPSLALAQAAEESGWGTSRFAQEGNALFGQWTFSDDGTLVPRRRDANKKHNVRAFPSLLGSVRAYIRNLNTHRAYRDFRRSRTAMRNAGTPLKGAVLAGTLLKYSERGQAYVETIRSIISVNGLTPIDDARLSVVHFISRPAI